MSHKATEQAYRRSPWKGNPAKFAVHLAVADTVNERREFRFWMSRAELAEKAGGASRRSVDGWFTEAVAMGLMLPVKAAIPGRRSAEYRYNMALLADEGNDCRLQPVQPTDCNDRSLQTATGADKTQEGTQEGTEVPTTSTSSTARAGEAIEDSDSTSPREETRAIERFADDSATVPEKTPPPTPSPIRAIFDLWVETAGKDPAKVKLTKDRERKVRARLREGYSLDECLDAVRGIRLSDFHMGKNDRSTVYDDLTVIFKSGTNVERFRDLWREHGATGVPVPGSRSVVQQVLDDMVANGIDPNAEMGREGILGARRTG